SHHHRRPAGKASNSTSLIILNLALRERTCYEPLASTHPDTQGLADDADHPLPVSIGALDG
ncbi:MAG: hypothetical protein M3Y89_03360, partial [Actinomycetota bacterium]|nr:hypothetical protein [Actinomycetota bacterium]